MRIEKIKSEIEKIASLDDHQEAHQEIKKLHQKINEPNIEARITGNWAYFYIIKYEYDPNDQLTKGKTKGKLGKMKKEKYLENKEVIDSLPVNKLKEKLISY
jgi:hypothetical protein